MPYISTSYDDIRDYSYFMYAPSQLYDLGVWGECGHVSGGEEDVLFTEEVRVGVRVRVTVRVGVRLYF